MALSGFPDITVEPLSGRVEGRSRSLSFQAPADATIAWAAKDTPGLDLLSSAEAKPPPVAHLGNARRLALAIA
jgi:hypothetical protein